MKIPVCPRCGQDRALKLTDNLTIRCFKAHGGCGELFSIHSMIVLDSSGLVTGMYREEDDPFLKRNRREHRGKKTA